MTGQMANAAGQPGVLMIARPTDESLAAAVRLPYSAYLEEGTPAGAGRRLEPTRAGGGLYFWFTTATAFRLGTARHFCDGLETRGLVTTARRGDIELALHEAVANAVIHGNLGLESDMRDDLARYSEFCQELDNRLDDPVSGGRQVEVSAMTRDGALELAVTDQGKGFPKAAERPPVGAPGSAGLIMHGLGIIHALATTVTTEDDGRCLVMRFAP